jgi:tetratricopeptide (TPR) repeat protein
VSGPLDRATWERIALVFDRVLDTGTAERPALLDQLCGSDDVVRREVEAMLVAHECGDGLLLERRLTTDVATPAPLDGALAEGARVGPYRVVAAVGAGGMGDVYRAERADGAYRQTVAIKVLRPGRRTAEMVRRFRIEREALARVVHPGIATILDGGTLEDGRPYIVLEFVDGAPITTYCTEHGLSLQERLALFVRVAAIVQFAHGRLVVHRDIKPSNILVQGDGAPRLLDFGIAKLLAPDTGDSLAMETRPEARVLTPEYAAPEQLRGEPPGTATDVWALGVLLFELLTGSRPFAATGRSASALERAILETPAPAPSSVVSARSRARRLRGDLDRIVLMALRKEPERRYASAAQLGQDVERWLAGRTVAARPDSVRYRAARFVARNRALVSAGAVVALLLVGFAATSTIQARDIARERDRAERERVAAEDVLRILTGLFERGDPNKHPGGDTLRVTALLDDAERAVAELGDDPARQAALWRAVGNMRAARGEYTRGLDLLTRSYEQRRALFGARDVEAARTHHEMGQLVHHYRGAAAARPLLDSSLTELRALLGEDAEDVRSATNDLLMATVDSVQARRLVATLMELERRAPSRDPLAVAGHLNSLGAQRQQEGRPREAAELFGASLEIVQRTLPPEHDIVRTVQRNLSYAYAAAGSLAQAESLQRAEVAFEERARKSPAARAMAHEALALTLVARHRLEPAEAEQRTALRLFREGTAPGHDRIWSAQRNLAFIVNGRGHPAEALALLDSAIAEATLAPGGDTSTAVAYLAAQRIPVLVRLRRLEEARRVLAAAERRLGSSPTVSAPHRGDVNRYAGILAFASGDFEGAVSRFRAAVRLTESPGDVHREPGVNSCLLGVALASSGGEDDARPLLGAPCSRYQAAGIVDPVVVPWIGEARARLR